MLKGTKYGLNRKYYYVQTNNAVEYIIRSIKAEMTESLLKAGVSQVTLDKVHSRGYLESCGAEEVVNNCANLLGPDLPGEESLTKIFPGWKRGPQLDDVVMLCFSDPFNMEEWQKIIPGLHGDTVMENRYMELHVRVAKMMFDVKAQWQWGRSWDQVYQAILDGNSVGMLIPGHYISAGIVDDEAQCLRIKDSWPGRKSEWRGNGFLQLFTKYEFSTVKQTVIYYKPQ